ncbi:monooxygenase [Mycobacterium haemophilum]|uniref:Monooxygenase n=1 Tax=Mycobacterium haemophilum TaxID=29311 RepID=A0A0I9U8T8_9MYCO|nr:monooxygenase [Mycobacterium haemophilum]KLO38579.1 monooxygenase [Mycobacterium haemophilum]KLO44914.1 monooxygenase [Mycobacterium haemophilum]KLO56256.1 monooxygenase [Mycobacterium haemophilum]
MTQTPSPAQARHRVVVIAAGAGGHRVRAELLATGVTDFAILDEAAGHEVISSVFDDYSHCWTLRTAAGEFFQGGVVITTGRSIYVPWIPKLDGRNTFRGESFHSAQWDVDFNPAGKHIAVVGTDATTGHYIGQLSESAASVTVFAHAPRRIVSEVPLRTPRVKRWLRRHTRPRAPGPAAALVRSSIQTVTALGVRTSDGVNHRADAIIYGTGFAIRDRILDETLVGAGGLTIRQAWVDGMEPYLGVAVHGFPNYFFITGPDIGAQARYVAECVGLLQRTASTRIEVRRSSQQVFNERVYLRPAQLYRVAPTFTAFDLSCNASDHDEIYDGAATLTIAGTRHPVRVRLTGHLNPIDGQYHWQGTVFDPLPDAALKQAAHATVTVGDRSAPARIVEQTPWGTHSIAGVGAPPYALHCP